MIKAYLAGQVNRYHTHPRMKHTHQTDADHSWGVAMLIMLLWPDARGNMIRAAILHDAEEAFGGDMPSHFKERFPKLRKEHGRLSWLLAAESGVPECPYLSDIEHKQLKFADQLEAALFMKLHGQEWSYEKTVWLLGLGEDLGVVNETIQLLNGVAKIP